MDMYPQPSMKPADRTATVSIALCHGFFSSCFTRPLLAQVDGAFLPTGHDGAPNGV